MTIPLGPGAALTRRRVLALGGSVAGGLLATTTLGTKFAFAASSSSTSSSSNWDEITAQIEDIIKAQGSSSDGVFSIEIDRDDLPNVKRGSVPIKPAFEINGTLYFQDLGDGQCAMNSDMALKDGEVDHFIDGLRSHNIVFQAEHQHFHDLSPLIWFIHFRAHGDTLSIAKGIKAALDTTSTPFPQTMPSNPTSPLPASQLGDIIGATPQIGSDGVVNFSIPRREPLYLGGKRINPFLNTATTIAFQPYGGDQNAVAAPDFGMLADEVDPVTTHMRKLGWDVGCLYNQETAESPQLYFSHQIKTGDSITLAKEIRSGLELTGVKLS